MSDFNAITAQYLKAYSERFLLSRVQWLRELLDHRVIDHIAWVDTRIMQKFDQGQSASRTHSELMAGTC